MNLRLLMYSKLLMKFTVRLSPLMTVLAVLLTALSLTLAQDDPASSRILRPGEPTVGVLTEDAVAQVYSFSVVGAGSVSLTVTADEGLVLSVVVTDAAGDAIVQATDIANSGLIDFSQIELPDRGTYYVTVFAAAGTQTLLTGSFTVLLEGDTLAGEEVAAATEAPGSDAGDTAGTDATQAPVTRRVFQPGEVITTGIEISLSWATTSDLNLQVRDPVGRTLYFDSRQTDNGGAFGFDVNGLCEVLIGEDETATETATWGSGAVATGSYELLIFYRQDCEGAGAVPFAVNVSVNGEALAPIEATLQAPVGDVASVYLASFIINPDGTAQVGPQGEYTDTRVLPEPVETYLQASSGELQSNVVQTGLITSDDYYQTFSFSGLTNDVVSITMTAQDGNLDTLLLVLDQTGRIVADNDDVEAAINTNSAIENLRLPVDGTYTVIATRYGKDVGGTEGNYQIVLSGATSELPQEVVDLGLPEGDIEITVIWNTTADLQLLVRDPVGDSVFDDDRDIASGGTLVSTGNIGCTPSATTPPTYYTYWPTGRARGGSYEVEVWYQNDCGDTTGVTATLFISVRDQLIAQTDIQIEPNQRYLTSFNIDSSGNAVMSEGGIIGGLETIDFTTEQPLTITLNGQQNGAITPQNKFDVYTFAGSAGDEIVIEMRRVNGSLDPLLYLIDPTGFEVASNDDVIPGENTDSLIEFTLPTAGTYTIIATHFGTIYGGTTGSYALTLSEG